MGFAVLRCEKCSQESLQFRGSHNERHFENHSNPDIDTSRTDQNLVLADYEEVNLYQEFKKRVDQVQANQTRKIRKDCPWAMEYIISFSPEDKQRLSPKEQEQYFKDAVDFFKKYHGAENVVSAIVHFDETTPHMHMLVLPMHENKLNSKFFMARNQLKSLHTEFHKKVGKKYGLMRGKEQKEGEPKKVHLSVEEYKAKQEQLKREKHLPDEIVLPAVEKKFLISESAEEYKSRVEVYLRDQLDVMKEVQKLHLAEPEVLKTLELKVEQANSALDDVYSEKQQLAQEHNSLKRENEQLKTQVEGLQTENQTLKQQLEIWNKTIENVKKFFEENNLWDLWNQFKERIKGKDKTQSKTRPKDMER